MYTISCIDLRIKRIKLPHDQPITPHLDDFVPLEEEPSRRIAAQFRMKNFPKCKY